MHNKWHPSYHHIELPHTAHTSLHFLSFIPYFNQCCSGTLFSTSLKYSSLPCPSPSPGACSTHVHWVGDTIQRSHTLSSPSSPTFNLSQHQGLFKLVSSLHQVAKVLEFQLQHQSFQWTLPGLISFRMDWLDLLAVQGTHKSLLHHCSSKASVFWCSAFFIVQLWHPYMTTGKTKALTRQT